MLKVKASVSKKLHVPVTTVANINKKLQVHGTIATLTGRGCKRKIKSRFNRRLVQMLEKEPRTASKETQPDVQVQCTSVSGRTYGGFLRDSGLYGGLHCRKKNII